RLVRTATTGFAVSWSPDSRRLAFSEQATGKGYQPGHVYLVNADGSGLRLFAGGETWNPRWSPSGEWILYDRTLHKPNTDVDQLVLRHPDGSGRHVLTGPRGFAGASWLPGGARLVAPARVRELGDPAGVVQLLDRHGRDCRAVAEQLGVPHFEVPDETPAGAPFEVLPLLRRRWWHEVALWFPQERTLVCADAVGTAP